jgi:23S rRNA (cytidine2498-2'-O)-methyltransferase
MNATTSLVAYCRAGFEAEVAADLRRIASAVQVPLDIAPTADLGYVIAHANGFDGAAWWRAQEAAPPIFARSVFLGDGPFALLPATVAAMAPAASTAATGGRADRVTPLLAAIERMSAERTHAPPWASAWIEFPDTNDGKELSPLARALHARVEGELRADACLEDGSAQRLHVFLQDGATAYVGTSLTAQASPWPMGIPRLRMPHGAPSRSTLKLAEALVTFLGERESTLLRPGLRAVDLGAAPGGWTWQLAKRGLRVTAVDNGPLKGTVASDPLVTHLREDGLTWRPKRAVDWLVCDIVEQPLRIADMVGHWIADGAARRAIFNLKLPMKKRYDEVLRCESRIDDIMARAGVRHIQRVRQLYHDREEVTAYLTRHD